MSDNLTVFGVDYTGVTGIKAKGTGNGTLTYIRPSGTKSITANGTGIDVTEYAAVDVSVSGGGSATLQSKSVSYTPSETAQSATVTPDSGYDGLSSVAVDVGAISSTYVGSGVHEIDETDPNDVYIRSLGRGEYGLEVVEGFTGGFCHTLPFGNEGIPTATKGSVSNHSITVTPSVTNTEGYIEGGTNTGDAVNVSASELVSGTLTISGSGTTDVTNYASASVAAGGATASATKGAVSNHSVTVTPFVTRTAGWVTAGTSNGTAVTVSASELVDGTLTINSSGTKDVTNYASASVEAGNATASATKGSVSNHSITVTPSVTRTAGFITGGTKNGTAVTVTASELVSGTVTIDSSGTKDVTNYASASVAAGGATASATKGTVSNHSVTVTPSVTRTAGYVTSGTSNGTAVTVSASELVSGSQTITDNGTVNVTNLASVTVDIDFVTYYTSSSNPTSSQGSDGDIWLVTS